MYFKSGHTACLLVLLAYSLLIFWGMDLNTAVALMAWTSPCHGRLSLSSSGSSNAVPVVV